jgi:tetratricopeptide (TPR) repeat protein
LDPRQVTSYKATTDSKMEQKLRRLLAQQPTDPETLDWLAYTLYSNNLLDEAIGCYTQLLAAGSSRPEHYFYCGNAKWKKGDRPAALELWAAAQRMDPAGLIGRKARARSEQATAGGSLVLTET